MAKFKFQNSNFLESIGIKFESNHYIDSFNFRTPGTHGNDITMSEQADAACPDEFSAWTMTCAGKGVESMMHQN